MERLAREKIAAQQRLAALRKEVPSIPGYGGDGSLDLGGVLPVVLQSQHHMAQQHQQQHQPQQQQQADSERSSPLTVANVQAHTLREENSYRPTAALATLRRDADEESNSGTSTASEGAEESEAESYLQRRLAGLANGPLKRPPPDEAEPGREADERPRPKYRAPSQAHATPAAATYVTMVPGAAGGVLELSDGPGVAGAALYHVRHPSAIFATSSGGHVQLSAAPQVLAAHPGVQLLTHSSSLKVLAAGPSAPVRVFAEGVSAALQPIMAVHAPSVVGESSRAVGPEAASANQGRVWLLAGGAKPGDDRMLVNGAAASQGGAGGTVFCTPSGVVIPGLVALPPCTEAPGGGGQGPNGGSGRSSPAYEPARLSGSSAAGYKPTASALASSQAGQSRTFPVFR